MTETFAFRSILVGTDGSETARRAVGHAVELARQADAKLVIVSAFGPGLIRESDAPPREEGNPEWIDTPRAGALDVLERAAWEATDAGVKTVEIFPLEGEPANAILDLAEQKGCDLIVVGNKGMTGARRLLGSVPNQISHHAPCSVLIVHTTG